MSVQAYSARRHYLNSLTANLGGHTPAEWAKLLRSGPRNSPRTGRRPPTTPAPKAAAKPAPNKAAAHSDRLRRLSRAEGALGPAPKPRVLRPVGPEASSVTMGGGPAFDPAPVCYAVDGATAPTGAAKRMNVQATHKQRLQRLARAESDMRR
jgi:hypothetical protein